MDYTLFLKRCLTYDHDRYKRRVKLAGVLYLHRISDGRITGTVNRNLRMLGKLSGVDPAKKLIFVTTMWDDKKVADRAEANEEELRNNFFKPMLDLGAGMKAFINTTDSARGIVAQLLLKHNLEEDHTVTLIQEEMGKVGKDLPETKAAQEVMTELQRLLAVHKKTIQELKRAAEKADNEQMIASLNKELAENQKQMDKTYKEVAKLKISFFKRLMGIFGSNSKVRRWFPSLVLDFLSSYRRESNSGYSIELDHLFICAYVTVR